MRLAHVPQVEPVRRELLEDALRFYQDFLSTESTDAELRAETARAYHRVGNIGDYLGNAEQSETAFRRAKDLWTALAKEFPNQLQYAVEGLRTQAALGVRLKTSRQLEAAQATYEAAIETASKLRTAHPLSVEVVDVFASLQLDLAELFRVTNRSTDAERRLELARQSLEPFMSDHPDNRSLRQTLARVHNNRALVFRTTQRLREAEAAYRQSLTLSAWLVAAEPTNAEFRRELAITQSNLGVVQHLSGASTDALATLQSSLECRRDLVRDFPHVPNYRQELTASRSNIAGVLKDLKRWSEAEALQAEAAEEQRKLIAEYPHVADFQSLLGMTLGNRAEVLNLMGQYAAARPVAAQAIEHQMQALAGVPANPMYQRFLRNAHAAMFKACLGEGDVAAAAASVRTVAQFPFGTPSDLFDAARNLGLCASAAKIDSRMAEPDRSANKDRYAQESVAILKRAIEAGWQLEASTVDNAAFVELRGLQEFQALYKK